MIPNKNENGKSTQQKPEEYIISHIGVNKFSYHQINIFIKLFMSQYKIENKKISFKDNGKDVTEDCIKALAECTQYFTLSEYAQLINENLIAEKDTLLKKDIVKKEEEMNNVSENSYSINKSNINLHFVENNNINIQNEIKNTSFDTSNINVNSDEKTTKESKDKISKNYEELRAQYIKKISDVYDKDLKNKQKEYKIPLIFIIKNTDKYKEIFLSDEDLKKYESVEISKEGNDTTSEKFLEEIKHILQLENPVLKTKDSNLISLKEIIDKDNYVITTDNFRKMILIIYRILADIPVILMGETGCGKTGLIRKLYQLLNNGEDMDPKKNMVNIDSSINDERLIEKMDEINKEAKLKIDKDYWILFDEINTCNSLGLLKEIFINRSYNGIKIEKNIRLIGTCNPYRQKTKKEENSGLSHPNKNKNNGLEYDVNILPQSLMYYVFNFGYLKTEDEDKYIKSILINHFKDFSIELINIVKGIISKCHKYLREQYGYSVVSLREIKRFIKIYDNLMKYYNNKDIDVETQKAEKDTMKNEEDKKKKEEKEEDKKKKEEKKKKNKENNKFDKKIENSISGTAIDEKNKLNQIKSLIVTTYLCYYIRLVNQTKRTNFESKLAPNLTELANYYLIKKGKNEIKDNNKCENKEKNNNEKQNNACNNNPLGIIWKPLLDDYKNFNYGGDNQHFSVFFGNECDYIIDNINLDKGIAKNRILKENIFLQFIAITANIPLIIIGKPGSSKSLSFQQLKKSMRGKYSEKNFFKQYPQLLVTYFQGSESTLAEDIDNLFEIGKKKLENNKDNKQISLLIFDEIGLSEFAKDNPVKVLHKNLEYDGVKDGLSFVGFSNWKLDSSKMNRVLYLSVPDLDVEFDDLLDTAKCIAESIRGNDIDIQLLRLLCKSYKSYQEMVRKIKDYVVYKKLEMQEMRQVLDLLTQDEIKKKFKKDKKEDITLDNFKKVRKELGLKNYSWNYGNFDDIKEMDKFKDLYAKDKNVNQEFHGNRDFYNYIKGVCNIKSLSKNLENNEQDINLQIEKVIERNFGGVDICLDLDFELDYKEEQMIKIKDILEKCPDIKKKLKIPSVFLFKYIFNEELKVLSEDNKNNSDETDNSKLERYKINEENLTKYDLIECINANINDNDARYLLLEIEEGLKHLICQNIINQNKGKIINYMEGSPFINDIKDKSGEYKIKKISEIQNYCNKEMLLILSNLNQIYAFLYDFFNRNFIIKDDKKYARICQGNFTDQLTYIHDKFRIIIMIDKNFIDKQESPFLNRFEKAIVKFEGLKVSSKSLLQELKLKETIEYINININYNIKNLLINFNEASIDRLYFYYSEKNLKQNENELKDKIFEKIARTLPQDVLIFFDDKHPIKSIYNRKMIFSYTEYKEYLDKLIKEKKNKFRFSIIYTFTNIISDIEGMNENNFSEIKRENQLIELINEKKFKNKRIDSNNFFIMHFYQHELDKINFIISTLKNNYPDEEIIFIFIVHIKRIIDKNKKEKVYSVLDIDDTVDQIFIDNLNGLNISLDDIAKIGIKKIIDNPIFFDKYNEFNMAIKTYYSTYTDKLTFISNYWPKVKNYFEENKDFIDIILEKSFSLIFKENINNETDETKKNQKIFEEIKKEIFENSYITSNTIDIVELIVKKVIIEKKIKGTIIKVLDSLESNNFINTLLNLDKNVEFKSLASKKTLCQMMEKYLNIVNITDIQKKAKFKANYLVPGFLSFYDKISSFISRKISESFFKNEKKLRDTLKGNIIKLKNGFLSEEEELLNKVRKEINFDESDDYRFVNSLSNKFESDLLLNDYINYFLDKNYEKNNLNLCETIGDLSEIEKTNSSFNENDENEVEENETDDFYLKIIKLIVDLRYKKDSKIILDNKDNEFDKFLIKIIWLEANKNYILTVIQIINEIINRVYVNKKRNILLEQLTSLIINNKIKYVADADRNPEHTREVNECYYIILGALFMAITDFEKILIYDPDNKKDFVEAQENQVKVKIDHYLECLKSLEKICLPFNDMLYLFSNELYIIVELNSIIYLLKEQKNEEQKNEYIDIQIIKNITKNLRENVDILRGKKDGKINELKENIENLINLISENIQNKDKKYFSLLRKILLQEIKKEKDKKYRLYIFNSYIINEKEILSNSNEIFNILLKGFIICSKGKLLTSIEKFENRNDEILILLEKKIKENKNEYLSHILMYYFEKMSQIYLDNYFKSKTDKKEEKNLLEKEPLDVFKKCIDLLSKNASSGSKIINVSKLLYIGYIRVFLYKFEENIRIKSEKLIEPKEIIKEINALKNNISFIIELYFYKIIYNKNNKDINVFTTKKDLYNLESLNNYKNLLLLQNNDDNFGEENEDKDNKFSSFNDLLEERNNNKLNSKEEYPFNEYFYYADYIDEKYLSENIKNKKEDYPVLTKYLELKDNGNPLNDFYIYNNALNYLNEEYSSKKTRDYVNNETLDKQLIYNNNKELFNQFIEIYNKMSDNNNDNDNSDEENENEIDINTKLNPKLPLIKFLIVDENEFSENYKNIYKQFIEKHNEIVEKLLDAKSRKKDKINIQKIIKEDEIFITKNDFFIYNVLFDYSYRKIIINDNYSEFNKYEINLEYIEEMLTDKFLKNKKLFSNEIFEFKYKNEDLEFKNKDICTKFKEIVEEEELNINDKIIIYEYFEENKGNTNLHLKLLDDFSELIIYSYQNIKKIEKTPKICIYKLLEDLEFISNDFKELFKEKNSLTINKLMNIYEYYQILCFNKVKEKLNSYQEKITDDKQKNLINNYIKNDLKTNEKIKITLEIALRKFILLFLSKETKKEVKIKLNNNNIKNYLEIEDLWNKEFYQKNEFYQVLKKLKSLGIKVNNIIHFYEKCFNNMYKDYFENIKTELKKREEEKKKKEKEKEKEDISNFNPKDVDIDEDQKEAEEKNEAIENKENNEEENIDDNGDFLIDEEEENDNNDNTDRY